jgi:hypothetical protein
MYHVFFSANSFAISGVIDSTFLNAIVHLYSLNKLIISGVNSAIQLNAISHLYFFDNSSADFLSILVNESNSILQYVLANDSAILGVITSRFLKCSHHERNSIYFQYSSGISFIHNVSPH